MKFPLTIAKDLSDDQIEIWNRVYKNPSADWDRTLEEGIWRRTRAKENMLQSGFVSDSDLTKRMLHYNYRYEVDESARELRLKDFYLWIHYTLATDEYAKNFPEYISLLPNNGWVLKSRNQKNFFYIKGDLELHLRINDSDFEDFTSFEFTFVSVGRILPEELRKRPWNILKTGIREKGTRSENHRDFTLEQLKELLPAQVELGCGPSIENGIPPLHFLHEVYSVSEDFRSKKFVFDLKKDFLLRGVLFDTEEYFKKLTLMYRSAFLAEPMTFYKTLKSMHARGHFVGEIINNNFDLLPSKTGLIEKFIRRFEEAHVAPRFEFHPNAKSLFVFGLHADRRKTQVAARKRGLRVVYVDTEGFTIDGVFYPYPLESIQESDYLYKEGATSAIAAMEKYLNSM